MGVFKETTILNANNDYHLACVRFVLGQTPVADGAIQIVTNDYEFCFHVMAMTRVVLHPQQQQSTDTEVDTVGMMAVLLTFYPTSDTKNDVLEENYR